MADIFANDGGSGTSPYETWAKAATTFLVAVDFASAPAVINLGADHTEAVGATTYSFPSDISNLDRVISVTPDTTTYSKASSAQITPTSTTDMILNGFVEFYGVYFEPGDDLIIEGNSGVLFDDSIIELSRAGTAALDLQGDNSFLHLKNTDLNWSSATGTPSNNKISECEFIWHGGRLLYGGNRPSFFLDQVTGENTYVEIVGVDLSALDTAIFRVSNTFGQLVAEVHHCLLHPSVSLISGTIGHRGTRILMSGCDDTTGNNLYRMEYVDFWGSTVHDDATFRTTGGAKDPDGNKISWKMVSAANAAEFNEPTWSPPITGWVKNTGTKTFKINCLWDSATNIQNDEAFIRLEFLELAADTDSAFADDRPTDILTAPADQTTNAVAWTISPSMTNANEFELSVTVTVNRVGPFIARIGLAKPSTTIFADPKVEIS